MAGGTCWSSIPELLTQAVFVFFVCLFFALTTEKKTCSENYCSLSKSHSEKVLDVLLLGMGKLTRVNAIVCHESMYS